MIENKPFYYVVKYCDYELNEKFAWYDDDMVNELNKDLREDRRAHEGLSHL